MKSWKRCCVNGLLEESLSALVVSTWCDAEILLKNQVQIYFKGFINIWINCRHLQRKKDNYCIKNKTKKQGTIKQVKAKQFLGLIPVKIKQWLCSLKEDYVESIMLVHWVISTTVNMSLQSCQWCCLYLLTSLIQSRSFLTLYILKTLCDVIVSVLKQVYINCIPTFRNVPRKSVWRTFRNICLFTSNSLNYKFLCRAFKSVKCSYFSGAFDAVKDLWYSLDNQRCHDAIFLWFWSN